MKRGQYRKFKGNTCRFCDWPHFNPELAKSKCKQCKKQMTRKKDPSQTGLSAYQKEVN